MPSHLTSRARWPGSLVARIIVGSGQAQHLKLRADLGRQRLGTPVAQQNEDGLGDSDALAVAEQAIATAERGAPDLRHAHADPDGARPGHRRVVMQLDGRNDEAMRPPTTRCPPMTEASFGYVASASDLALTLASVRAFSAAPAAA